MGFARVLDVATNSSMWTNVLAKIEQEKVPVCQIPSQTRKESGRLQDGARFDRLQIFVTNFYMDFLGPRRDETLILY